MHGAPVSRHSFVSIPPVRLEWEPPVAVYTKLDRAAFSVNMDWIIFLLEFTSKVSLMWDLGYLWMWVWRLWFAIGRILKILSVLDVVNGVFWKYCFSTSVEQVIVKLHCVMYWDDCNLSLRFTKIVEFRQA